MRMKRIFRGAIAAALMLAAASATAQTAPARHELFPYPVPPESITLLRERCNFLVYHFWERADMKKVFDRPEGLNAAFGDWISFMPYCAADTAHLAIKNLIGSVSKDGKRLLRVAQMAENWTYSDTAEIVSDELYLPFAAAAATSKKIPEADRRHFAQHLRRINSTSLGQTMPALPYIAPDGSAATFETDSVSGMVVIADPSDSESTMASIRFSIDPATRSLVENGELRIAWFYPGQLTPEVTEALAKLPENWTRGAMPDADDFFTLRIRPAIYLLDERGRIILKDRPYAMALQVFNVMANGQK